MCSLSHTLCAPNFVKIGFYDLKDSDVGVDHQTFRRSENGRRRINRTEILWNGWMDSGFVWNTSGKMWNYWIKVLVSKCDLLMKWIFLFQQGKSCKGRARNGLGTGKWVTYW